ncbi:MAG: NAD(P)-dependent oxidoreductase [Maribacter sp.]
MGSKRVLILGGSGMLGSMLCDYFVVHTDCEIAFTYHSNPSDKLAWPGETIASYPLDVSNEANLEPGLIRILTDFDPDYVINCIGLIKNYCNDPSNSRQTQQAIRINSIFPYSLAKLVEKVSDNAKIIQIATDCVYDGLKGKYNEHQPHDALDVYGKTKSLGEVVSPNFLNIRCSIIGPELSNKSSLLEWFLSNPDGTEVMGFEHHFWNGVTTLQFAQYCHGIIANNLFHQLRDINHTLHYVVNSSVNKYELLHIFNSSFQRTIGIAKKNDSENIVDRTISSIFLNLDLSPMEQSIEELKSYIRKSNVFKNR